MSRWLLVRARDVQPHDDGGCWVTGDAYDIEEVNMRWLHGYQEICEALQVSERTAKRLFGPSGPLADQVVRLGGPRARPMIAPDDLERIARGGIEREGIR